MEEQEVDAIQDRVVGLQRSMKNAVETALDKHVVPEIEAITVWLKTLSSLGGVAEEATDAVEQEGN